MPHIPWCKIRLDVLDDDRLLEAFDLSEHAIHAMLFAHVEMLRNRFITVPSSWHGAGKRLSIDGKSLEAGVNALIETHYLIENGDGQLVMWNWDEIQADYMKANKKAKASEPKQGPTARAPREKAATGQERAFSAETEALFAYAVDCLADAGHKTPKTAKQIRDAKDVLRLMQESDEHTPDEIHKALEFMRGDTGTEGWSGWRAVTQSVAGFRKKYSKIRAAMHTGTRREPDYPAAFDPKLMPKLPF